MTTARGAVALRFSKDRRRSTVWWSLGVFLLVLFSVSLYPTVRNQASVDQVVKDLPEALKSALSIDESISLTSAPGYLQGRLFGLLVPLLLIMFAIGIAARATAASEEDGTLELLLSRPVSRTTVMIERFLSMTGSVIVLVAVLALSTLLLAVPFGVLDGVSTPGLIAAAVGAGSVGLLFGSICFLVGATTGRRGVSIGVASGLATVTYLLHGISSLSPNLNFLGKATPWGWYLADNMLVKGPNLLPVFLPLGISLVLAGLATYAFNRRDLR